MNAQTEAQEARALALALLLPKPGLFGLHRDILCRTHDEKGQPHKISAAQSALYGALIQHAKQSFCDIPSSSDAALRWLCRTWRVLRRAIQRRHTRNVRISALLRQKMPWKGLFIVLNYGDSIAASMRVKKPMILLHAQQAIAVCSRNGFLDCVHLWSTASIMAQFTVKNLRTQQTLWFNAQELKFCVRWSQHDRYVSVRERMARMRHTAFRNEEIITWQQLCAAHRELESVARLRRYIPSIGPCFVASTFRDVSNQALAEKYVLHHDAGFFLRDERYLVSWSSYLCASS